MKGSERRDRACDREWAGTRAWRGMTTSPSALRSGVIMGLVERFDRNTGTRQ